MLQLCVLGPTTLELDGEPLQIGGRGQRAVLLRLAYAEGHLVTVERLVEDLWGEDAPSSIVATLHGYVSRLRGALRDANRLRRQGPGYLLDLSADEMDARAFEALARRGRELVDTSPAGAVAELDRALALWRGPAYADVADLDWAAAAAVRLEELRLGTREARFDALLNLGQHSAAVAEIERALIEHPLRERFAAQLMLALYRGGRQADALRVFERTRRVLLDELGLDPSPELVRYEGAILAHEAWLATPTISSAATATYDSGSGGPAAADQQPQSGVSPVPLPPAAIRHAHRPFVGRVEPLATLGEAWKAALSGQRRFAVIEGEAGAGKSRLAAYFASIAHGDGAIVLWGRATTTAIVPYEPLVEALRTVLHTVSPEARQRVISGRDALNMLMPLLSDLAPADEASPRPELGTDRYVLFETVAELLDAESAVWPMVVVIDDLQWTDPLSLRLLQHLMQHERPARLLVIGTVRTVPATPSADLDLFLGDLHRDGLLSRVALSGLAESEVAELLDASGGTIPVARAAAIHRATHGNPFFVTELAEHGEGASLPASVHDVLGARIAGLKPAATRILNVAAVAGTVVPVPVLSKATGLATDEFLDSVDDVLAAGFLAEEGGGEAALTFRHALVQQVVLERLSRARRTTLHLALADAVEAVGPTHAQLAHHLLEAGSLAPIERTVAAAVAAGRDSLGVLAYEDAAQWAQRCFTVTGTIDASLRCEALLLLSDARRALGDRFEARAAAAEAAGEARRTGDAVLLARSAEAVALARAGIGFDFGTEDRGLDELLAEALSVLPDTEVDQRSKLLEASLSNAAADGDLLALQGLSEQALELAEAHGYHALVATAHLAARMSNWKVTLLEQRLGADRLAIDAAQRSGQLPLQLNTLLYLITDLTEAGEIAEAARWFDRLRDLAGQVRQPVYDAFVMFFDATIALLQGKYDESAALADQALLRGLQSHGVNAEQAWAGHAFIRAWDQGELAGMVDLVEKAAARPPHWPVWRAGLGACLIAAGRPEEARPVLVDLVTPRGLQHNPDSLWLAVGALLAEIARELHDEARAAILVRELQPYSGRVIMTGLGRVSLGLVDRYLGVAAYTSGDFDAAEGYLRSAARQARAMGAVPHEARAMHDRFLVLTARGGDGDEAEAARVHARAVELADSVGLVLGGLRAASPR